MGTGRTRSAPSSRVALRRRAAWTILALLPLMIVVDVMSDRIEMANAPPPAPQPPQSSGEGEAQWQEKLDCLVDSAAASGAVCDPTDETVVDAAEQARAFGVSPHGDTAFMRRAVPLPPLDPVVRARFQAAGMETDAPTVQRLLAPLADDPATPPVLRYRALLGQAIAGLRDGSPEQSDLAARYLARAGTVALPDGVPMSDVQYLGAEVAAAAGDWQAAAALLEQAVTDDPIFFDALWLLVVARIHLLADDADICPAVDRIETRLDQMRAVSTDRTGFMALLRRNRSAGVRSQPVIHYVRGYVALLAGDFASTEEEFGRLAAFDGAVTACEQRLIERASHAVDRLVGTGTETDPDRPADVPGTPPP